MAGLHGYLEKLKWPIFVLLVVNAIDLSTSLIPSPVDRSFPVPDRELWEWIVQCALLPVLAVLLFRARASVIDGWRRVQVPKVALWICAGFLSLQCLAVALRFEAYPFSPVAMYSNALKEPLPREQHLWAFVLTADGSQNLLSIEREGTPFRQYLSRFDTKSAAAVTMYARSSAVFFFVAEDLIAQGYPPPVLVQVVYDAHTGEVRGGASHAYTYEQALEAQRSE